MVKKGAIKKDNYSNKTEERKSVKVSKNEKQFLLKEGINRLNFEIEIFSTHLSTFILAQSFLFLAYVTSFTLKSEVNILAPILNASPLGKKLVDFPEGSISLIIALLGLVLTVYFLFVLITHYLHFENLDAKLRLVITGYNEYAGKKTYFVNYILGVALPGIFLGVWILLFIHAIEIL